MKALINVLLFAAAAMIFAACGRDAGGSALDAVGDNAVAVITVNPKAVAASAGVTDIAEASEKLPAGRNFADLRTLLSLDGIDMDCWVSACFDEGSRNVTIVAVRDEDALEGAFGKLGYKKSDKGGFGVYSPANVMKATVSRFFIIDDGILWMIESGVAGTAVSELQKIKEKYSGPLTGWKREALTSPAAINAVGGYAGRNFKIAVSLVNNKMDVEAYCVDAEGGAAKWVSADCGHLDAADAANLSAGNVLSFAVAENDYSELMKLLSRYGIFEFSSAQLAMVSASVAGPVYGNLDLRLPMQGLDDVSVNLTVTAKGAAAAGLIGAAVKNELAGQGLAGVVDVKTDGNLLQVATKNGLDKAAVPADEVDGCIAWANLNIPAELLDQFAGTDRCGVNVRFALRDDSAALTISFPDSDEPFLATLSELLRR